MIKVDKIIEMINVNKPIDIQLEGIELAKNVKFINAFILPSFKDESKNLWENCAKIISNREDEELSDYLLKILYWLKDMNVPGAFIIRDRFFLIY